MKYFFSLGCCLYISAHRGSFLFAGLMCYIALNINVSSSDSFWHLRKQYSNAILLSFITTKGSHALVN